MNHSVLRKIRVAAFLLIFLLAGLYANIYLSGTDEKIATSSATAKATVTGEPLLKLPEFSMEDLQGQLRSINEFAGKPMLINFWATWCAPCLREMPMLQEVWQSRQAGGTLTVIGVAVDQSDTVAPYLQKTGVTYPILVGLADAMAATELFKPDFVGLPYTVFTDAEGNILNTHSGELSLEQLTTNLEVMDALERGDMTLASARVKLAAE